MNSHSRIVAAVLLSLSIITLVVDLSGEGPPASVTGNASFGAFNRYIFRGYRLGRDSGVLEPSLSVSMRGFTATFWGNIDMKEGATPSFVPDRPGRKSFDETDLTLSYARQYGRIGLTGGFIYYGTKFTPETQEIYVGAGLDVPGKPTLTIYRDIDAYPGTYILLSLSQAVALKRGVTLDLGASAAYFIGSSDYWRTYLASAGGYVGEKYRALHDGMVRAALTIALARGLGLQAGTQFYFPLSSAAGRSIDGHSYNINGCLTMVAVFGATLIFGF